MKTSYSAEGEDILIQKLLERCFYMDDHTTGTYVDVGAYHPWVNSNTAALFLQGWSGVNIDARPGSMEAFKRERPGDVNVESGVGVHGGNFQFYLMDRPELSGFLNSVELAKALDRGAEVVRDVQIRMDRLEYLLGNVPRVDFLNIDVEGCELAVLQGHDWEKRPKVIAVEVISTHFRKFLDTPVVQFLEAAGYQLASRLHCTAIFVDGKRAVWR